jgi:hypothetical protein
VVVAHDDDVDEVRWRSDSGDMHLYILHSAVTSMAQSDYLIIKNVHDKCFEGNAFKNYQKLTGAVGV